MSLENELARMLIRNQPVSIRDRLMQNEELLSLAELNGGSYPGLGTFSHDKVIMALQESFECGMPVSMQSNEGNKFLLKRLTEGVLVSPSEHEGNERLILEFEFLDPEKEIRLKALEKMIANCKPSFPSQKKWWLMLEKSPLSSQELIQLLSDFRNSPIQVHATISQKWRNGEVNTDDIFPKSLAYYEALIGPSPDGQNVESYIKEVLIPHQRILIQRSLHVGLMYALSLNLDPRINASSLVAEIQDDTLLDALTILRNVTSPFSLLGILEIALSRLKSNDIFRDIAADTTDMLSNTSLMGREDNDIYQLMPPLMRACLRWISVKEELWCRPPYWRRLAAFSHAHFLLDIMTYKHIDIASFTDWCNQVNSRKMLTVELLDMQKEPLWRAEELSTDKLRSATVHRLVALVNSAKERGLDVPNWQRIEKAIHDLKSKHLIISSVSPGPLEYSQRILDTADIPTTDSEEVVEVFRNLATELVIDQKISTWYSLATSSQLLCFDKTLLETVENAIQHHITYIHGNESNDYFFHCMSCAAYIAATQPAISISNAVITCLVKEAKYFTHASESDAGYHVILMASAAFIDKGRWLEWLIKWLSAYAFSLPAGKPSRELIVNLETLQTFLPVSDRCLVRAIKIASAAI